jgi:hypothetical protein
MAEYQTLPPLNMQGVGSMNMQGVGSSSNNQSIASSSPTQSHREKEKTRRKSLGEVGVLRGIDFNMMASDGEEEDEGGEKTTPYPCRRTTIELLSEENGWLTVLSKQHVQDDPASQHMAGSSDTSSLTTQGVQLCKPIMASIKVKTKTCDGTQEHGGWLSPLSGPQRSRSLTDKDNFDLDGDLSRKLHLERRVDSVE